MWSLRSRGDVDVNLFARKYFDGGGHKNAAGGKSYVSMDETIAHYIRSVEEFAREGGLDTPPPSVVRCGIGFRGESASEPKNQKPL